jgi:hypothetical protein
LQALIDNSLHPVPMRRNANTAYVKCNGWREGQHLHGN